MQQAEEPKQTKITGMLVSLLEAQFYFGADSEITVMVIAQFYSIVNFSSCYTCRTLGWKDTSLVGNHGDILLKDT